MLKIKNVFLALKDQLPLKRLFRNIWNGRIRGLFHIRSHLNENGSPKIRYGSKASAQKAAKAMEKKRGVPFGCWKCVHCDGYHIGKNRQE